MKKVIWECRVCGDTEEISIYPDPCVIDAAWAEAEAALPEGAALEVFGGGTLLKRYVATARDGEHLPSLAMAGGDTPAAALRALAAKLATDPAANVPDQPEREPTHE